MLATIRQDLLSTVAAGGGSVDPVREELQLHFLQPYIAHWQRLVREAQ